MNAFDLFEIEQNRDAVPKDAPVLPIGVGKAAN